MHHALDMMYASSQTLLYKRLRCLHRPYFCSQTWNFVYKINQNLSSTSKNLNGFKIKKIGKHSVCERSTSRTYLSFFGSKTPTLGFLKSRPHSGTPKLNIFKKPRSLWLQEYIWFHFFENSLCTKSKPSLVKIQVHFSNSKGALANFNIA